MKQFEIYWSDLSEETQKRLAEIYHENIELSPLAIIDVEEEEEAKQETLKKVFTIMVALDTKNFEHYCTDPQSFYDSYEEAEVQIEHLIQTKEFKHSQLKIKQLWKLTENNS